MHKTHMHTLFCLIYGLSLVTALEKVTELFDATNPNTHTCISILAVQELGYLNPEDEGTAVLSNVRNHQPDNAVSSLSTPL